MKKLLLLLLLSFVMQGCSSSDRDYDEGEGDGYAAGYNTTCNIRATLVKVIGIIKTILRAIETAMQLVLLIVKISKYI